ncbi:calmodulin-binding protein 60 D-like isoform X2 [Nymphaea colorata]|uniref:calmodulin-binding protein 60 D-like isoform X2 n=1 Tax=Nymphaea colorata TaxID=210225 RepID=UPI00129E8FC4|nr:calmodulin-binding protein 60 D-like isoform X2 [Nymphaea colorata]
MQRPTTRFLERSTSMRRGEKRGLEVGGDADERLPEEKRHKVPALASVIVEALKVDSLQKLCSSLEPILRRVVSEEVERALARMGPTKIGGRTSPKRIEGPDGRNLQLHFRSRLSLPLFTGGKVEGEQGSAIHVVLLDATTCQVLTSGQESCAKLDVVVLEGDFNNEDDDNWVEEDFESHVVKEREGKRPLLTGDLQVTLKEGVGTLGDLTFTDNSSWIRSRKFRLGLKVASGYCEGIRIREAKTEAFTVKDHRGELYKKHYPPAFNDEVWRLEKIGKDGSFHKRLSKAGVYTVEDFLRLVVRDPQKLRNILGSGMSNKMWETAVDHAKTCVLGGKLYVYYNDDSRNVGVVFNNIYALCGLIAGGQYCPAETLTDTQKVYVDTLVKKAYDNWMHVVEYDGKALMAFKQSKKMITTRSDTRASSSEYQSFDPQASVQQMPFTASTDQVATDPGIAARDATTSMYTDNSSAHYSALSQPLVPNSQLQFDTVTYPVQNQPMGSSHQMQGNQTDSVVGLGLGPPQPADCGFTSINTPVHSMNMGPLDDWAQQRDHDFFSEEEIRSKSSEMLEHDDMQQLLRLFSMGGGAMNMSDYEYTSYVQSPMPNYTYNEDRGSRSSGKAVVGWLKLKAALRWGIFIRKIAAEKRAQLVELEDS